MMNTSRFSMRLRELSDDYSNQRVMAEEYRAERKIVLDELDKVLNGIDAGYSSEKDPNDNESSNVTAVDANTDDIGIVDAYTEDNSSIDDINIVDALNLEEDTNVDDDVSIVDALSISDDVYTEDVAHTDESDFSDSNITTEGISKKLNSILGRLDDPGNDDKA